MNTALRMLNRIEQKQLELLNYRGLAKFVVDKPMFKFTPEFGYGHYERI